jgi:hypothetical protein
LAALYLVVAGLGVALLVASVIAGLFFPRQAAAAAQTDLRDCERDLTVALERMRSHIPAHMADLLKPQGDREPVLDGRIQSSIPIAARCAHAANSPATRAIREAADALGELDRGVRRTDRYFQQNVADPVSRADNALHRARALLGKQATLP